MSQSGSLGVTSGMLPPEVATSYQTNSGTAIPVSNVLNILGETVVAGSTPFQFTGLGNTVTGQIQRSQAIASTDASKIGLSAFNSAQFTVDANGFVSASGTGVATTLTGNSGIATPVANNINVITANSTVKFVGSGSTLTQDFGLSNLIVGATSASITSALRNVSLGQLNLNPLTTGTDNTAIGYNALKSVTTASLNTAVGAFSQQTLSTGATGNTSIGYASLSVNTGSSNTAIGYSSLTSCTADQNTALGSGALGSIVSGVKNLGIGADGFNGNALTGSDSSNIMIGHSGVAGDSTTIRIGTQVTSGTGKQNKCFIAGIVGVTSSNAQAVTIDSTTGQLGVLTITSGTVTSVSGTANRVTSTGGSTPVIDISAAYVGQSSLTTLGTITTGIWNGTKISEVYGGTNQATYATGDILYASGANTLSKLAAGSNTNVLTLVAGVPAWVAPATAGTVTSVSGTTNRITSTGGNTPVIDISASYVGQSSITTLGTITTGVWTGTNIALANGGTNASLTASNGGIFYSTATAGAILSGVATAGKMLRSGLSTAPTWSTATFPDTATGTGTILRADGTNWAATTATYPNSTTSQQILYSTSANVVGQLTTANSSLPATNASGTLAMRAFSVVIQTFAANGTYTPTTGMLYCEIEIVGSGGGGGGTASTTASQIAYAGGGGSGEYAKGVFSAATVGASQVVTCPAGGNGGTAGANNGTGGSTTSVGALITAAGGSGGAGQAASATTGGANGGAGGTGGTGGSFRTPGQAGWTSAFSFGVFTLIGRGAAGMWSGGTLGTSATATGITGTGSGGGGGGATATISAAALAGGPGSSGRVVITEYVIN